MFLLDAQALRMNAAVYESYANQFKAMAASYKSFANTYMSLANQFAGTAFSAVYRNLSNAYNTYSTNYANLANSYLNIATSNKNQVAIYSSYENYVSYYADLANNAITEATAAQQVAEQYSKKAEQGNIVNEAYQEILADSEYNYFYKVLKQDSFNRVTQYLSGNGLITTKEYDNAGALNHIATGYNFDDSIRDLNFEYDKVANVTKREDNKLGVTQTYQYDNLNRIVTANSFTQDNTTQMSYAYDSIGNMTYKSDIGDYNYNNQSPHQVTQAGEKNFEYDLNGNMTNNNGTLIEYTPFNKPSKLITQNDTVEFSYDTNKNRYKKSTDKYTSYYIDKSYEYKINKDNSVEHKYFIYEDSKVISIYTDSSSNISTKYLHYDSLNSVDTITNNLGVVEERMAYKPFGEKLNLDKDGKESTTAPYTNRGYTGHEHIEETNLIHMNGRVCDPTIGRFTSADPYIQAPYNTQSFNRYSYVMNNPLKYVDPSGYYYTGNLYYGNSSYSSGFTISISGFTFGGYGYGYHDYFMQQQRAQIRAAQARANAQAVAAAWQRILQAQAQNAAQAQATAAQQTQLQQNLNYQSVSISSVSTNVSTIPFLISDSALLELTYQSQDYANSFNWVAGPLSALTMDITYGKMENPAMEDTSDLFIALGVSAKLLETGIAYIGGLFESGMKVVGKAIKNVNPHILQRTHSLSGKSSIYKVDTISDKMRLNGFGDEAIDVASHKGQYYVLDGHHRLAAAKRSSTQVNLNVIDDIAGHHSNFNNIDEVLDAANSVGFDNLVKRGRR